MLKVNQYFRNLTKKKYAIGVIVIEKPLNLKKTTHSVLSVLLLFYG